MGIPNVSANGTPPPRPQPSPEERCLPADLDLMLEFLLARMIGLLFIEISAFHGFRWAQDVLSDTELVQGDGEPARIVSYIQADETPHVAYLRTALSEMRDRTWIGASGAQYDGAEMMDLAWSRALNESVFVRRSDNLKLALREVEHALGDRTDKRDIVDEMLTMGDIRLLADGTPVDPDHPRYEEAA
jgi:hypothetical protein